MNTVQLIIRVVYVVRSLVYARAQYIYKNTDHVLKNNFMRSRGDYKIFELNSHSGYTNKFIIVLCLISGWASEREGERKKYI